MMTVPDEGTFAVRAEPTAATEATAAPGPIPQGPKWLLPAGALLLAGVLVLYLADVTSHLSYMTAMRDLVVYRNGGLIARHVPPAYDAHRASPLYDWTGQNGVQFTYPPFAAVIFAVGSVLSWTAMRWAMTLGQPGRPRAVTVAGVRRARLPGGQGYGSVRRSACPRWRWPPNRSSRPWALGQVNLLLMLLVTADLLTGGAQSAGRPGPAGGTGPASGSRRE